ncbi:UNVERIFIED_CONTAM: hypothetical protein FKN15_061808 [Acipenser sinensis]
MRCCNCGEQGHQRRACLRKNRNEERQEQGTDSREEAGDVGGEQEDEAAPPSQRQPESAETREPPIGMKPPTPQPRLKRLSHGLSQNEATGNDEAFVMVAKKKLKKKKNKEAADLPNRERGTEQSPKPVLEGSLQSQAGVSVPPDMEGEGSDTAMGLQPGAVQRSSFSEPQQVEAEAAVMAVAVLGGGEESGAVEVERATEELAARTEQRKWRGSSLTPRLSLTSLIANPLTGEQKFIPQMNLNCLWRVQRGKGWLKLKTSSPI